MSAAAVAAPVWSPDTDPAHTLCHLLDCLLAAFDQADTIVREWLDYEREPDGSRPPYISPTALRTLRAGLEATQDAIWQGQSDGVRDRLSAAAVARLVRAGDAAAMAQAAVMEAERSLSDLALLPVDQIDKSEDGKVMAAKAARAGLLMALARCGEPPPPHDWRGIADPVDALPTAFRPRSAFVLTVPPQYRPMAPAAGTSAAEPPHDTRSEVEFHTPDGPGPNLTVRWKGNSVQLTRVRYRVVAYMWHRDAVGFDELAEHVNENRPHATPTPRAAAS